MTIKNFLKKQDKDLSLKVGAKDGTGFFYVGTVADFLKNIDEYDNIMRNRTARIQILAEKAYEAEIKNAPTLEAFAKDRIRKEEPLLYNDFRASVEYWFERVTIKHTHHAERNPATQARESHSERPCVD